VPRLCGRAPTPAIVYHSRALDRQVHGLFADAHLRMTQRLRAPGASSSQDSLPETQGHEKDRRERRRSAAKAVVPVTSTDFVSCISSFGRSFIH
jgi:hypothetical protein